MASSMERLLDQEGQRTRSRGVKMDILGRMKCTMTLAFGEVEQALARGSHLERGGIMFSRVER